MSTGQTITLEGLNALLAAGERHLGLLGQSAADAFTTPGEEAEALLTALAAAIDTTWDGRRCVETMRDAEFRHWRQTEWIGWHFEYVGIAALVNAFGGGPKRVLNTSFDYSLRTTWDLKAHSSGGENAAILNDLDAIETGLTEPGGLGFIVLTAPRSTPGIVHSEAPDPPMSALVRSSPASHHFASTPTTCRT